MSYEKKIVKLKHNLQSVYLIENENTPGKILHIFPTATSFKVTIVGEYSFSKMFAL
jgi:hypothetical protein